MKATAFAPGHISGFFEPVFNHDFARTGSRGAGINVSLGALSEVIVDTSTKQDIEIFFNTKKANAPVTRLAIKYMIGENPLKIKINTRFDLPISQGFGMSAAGALSATYALARIIKKPLNEGLIASHFAEVTLKTGLGDVMACSFGGVEIRKNPGLPPWGTIEHIPCKKEIILCIIGKKIQTKKVLEDKSKIEKITNYGKFCIKKLTEKPTIENLFLLSQTFTIKTELANENILQAIESVSKYGIASMCMLGNSIFAIGKTEILTNILSTFGKILVCGIDEAGARVIENL